MPQTQERSVVLLDQFGRPLRPERRTRPRGFSASYDAAADTPANQRHWANADGLSAKQANSPEVRRKLRERARLEFDNGGNCKGAIETIAHDLVGTGPRLQLTLPDGAPEGAAEAIERKFREWCDDPTVNFADKLRIMVESELRDGESFAIFTNNDAVAGPVKFDFRVIETEQIATPTVIPPDASAVDGIVFDSSGNAKTYHLLKAHPGDLTFNFVKDFTPVPANAVVHWFRPYRAGQCRGIPRITPGLPLIAQIRGYTAATLAAARLAAHYAAILKTDLIAPEGDDPAKSYDDFPLNEAGGITLPYGWDLTQLKSEHPTSSHKEFRETCLTEFGRAIHLPRNKVTGDSSGYNFSSARMDDLDAKGAIRIERNRFSIRVVDRLFKAWAEEAVSTPGYLPLAITALLPPLAEWTWVWRFDAFQSIDPVKDAVANEKNLQVGLVTHGELLADRGIDWRDHFKSLAEQRAYARELGIDDLLYAWLAKAAVPARTGGPTSETERDTILEDEEEAVVHA